MTAADLCWAGIADFGVRGWVADFDGSLPGLAVSEIVEELEEEDLPRAVWALTIPIEPVMARSQPIRYFIRKISMRPAAIVLTLLEHVLATNAARKGNQRMVTGGEEVGLEFLEAEQRSMVSASRNLCAKLDRLWTSR